MNPHLASLLAALFILLAGAAVLIMLEISGRTADHTKKTIWISVHKILGYLFISLFVLMLGFMINKVAGLQEELSPRAVVHTILALILVPIILFKILIVRRHPRLTSLLPFLGIAIFTLSTGLTGITAGYYLLHKSNLAYTTLSARDEGVLDPELGKAIMNKKCNKCHSMERIYRAFKSEKGWAGTVNKMAILDSPNISSFDIKQLLHYLTIQQKTRQARSSKSPEMEIGKTLISQKCNLCHNLDRIFAARKSKSEWSTTVARMIATMDDSEFLSNQEKTEIVSFLSKRKK